MPGRVHRAVYVGTTSEKIATKPINNGEAMKFIKNAIVILHCMRLCWKLVRIREFTLCWLLNRVMLFDGFEKDVTIPGKTKAKLRRLDNYAKKLRKKYWSDSLLNFETPGTQSIVFNPSGMGHPEAQIKPQGDPP